MPNLAFDIRDYSTQLRIRLRQQGRGSVLVPRRRASLPPLQELPYSNYRHTDEDRNYFPTAVNLSGDVVVPDVPPGNYTVRFRLPGYVEHVHGNVASPGSAPLRVTLYRAPEFPFGKEDTVIRGALSIPVGTQMQEYTVLTLPQQDVRAHEVPVSGHGFAIYIPEKTRSSIVTLRVHRNGNPTTTQVSTPVELRRPNRIPPIVVT